MAIGTGKEPPEGFCCWIFFCPSFLFMAGGDITLADSKREREFSVEIGILLLLLLFEVVLEVVFEVVFAKLDDTEELELDDEEGAVDGNIDEDNVLFSP